MPGAYRKKGQRGVRWCWGSRRSQHSNSHCLTFLSPWAQTQGSPGCICVAWPRPRNQANRCTCRIPLCWSTVRSDTAAPCRWCPHTHLCLQEKRRHYEVCQQGDLLERHWVAGYKNNTVTSFLPSYLPIGLSLPPTRQLTRPTIPQVTLSSCCGAFCLSLWPSSSHGFQTKRTDSLFNEHGKNFWTCSEKESERQYLSEK